MTRLTLILPFRVRGPKALAERLKYEIAVAHQSVTSERRDAVAANPPAVALDTGPGNVVAFAARTRAPRRDPAPAIDTNTSKISDRAR